METRTRFIADTHYVLQARLCLQSIRKDLEALIDDALMHLDLKNFKTEKHELLAQVKKINELSSGGIDYNSIVLDWSKIYNYLIYHPVISAQPLLIKKCNDLHYFFMRYINEFKPNQSEPSLSDHERSLETVEQIELQIAIEISLQDVGTNQNSIDDKPNASSTDALQNRQNQTAALNHFGIHAQRHARFNLPEYRRGKEEEEEPHVKPEYRSR